LRMFTRTTLTSKSCSTACRTCVLCASLCTWNVVIFFAVWPPEVVRVTLKRVLRRPLLACLVLLCPRRSLTILGCNRLLT
jgi:hypothetical protein